MTKFKTDLATALDEKLLLETKRDSLEGDLQASLERETSLQSQLHEAKACIQDLEDTLAATRADNITLKAEITLKDELIAEEQAKYPNAMAILFAEQEKTQSLEARVAQLQELLTVQTTTHVDSLKGSRDTLKPGMGHKNPRVPMG